MIERAGEGNRPQRRRPAGRDWRYVAGEAPVPRDRRDARVGKRKSRRGSRCLSCYGTRGRDGCVRHDEARAHVLVDSWCRQSAGNVRPPLDACRADQAQSEAHQRGSPSRDVHHDTRHRLADDHRIRHIRFGLKTKRAASVLGRACELELALHHDCRGSTWPGCCCPNDRGYC